jgi:hypothetical protein
MALRATARRALAWEYEAAGLGANRDAFVIGVDDRRLMTRGMAGRRDDANPACDLPVPVDQFDAGTGKIHPLQVCEKGLAGSLVVAALHDHR